MNPFTGSHFNMEGSYGDPARQDFGKREQCRKHKKVVCGLSAVHVVRLQTIYYWLLSFACKRPQMAFLFY